VQLFGPIHISLLAAIAVIVVALPFLFQRGIVPMRGARLTIGWALAVNEAIW
jgi:hypothetical protein